MDSAVWPRELQTDGAFTRKGQIVHWDDPQETTEGDFFGLKDIHQGTGPVDEYEPSAAFQTLVEAYQYWIADADIDGFRVDTVKHMDPGATRYFASAIHEFAQTIGKDSFFLVGEITGSREEAIRLRDLTGLDAALGLADVQGRMVDAVKGWSDPAEYFDLFRNSIQVDKATHTWFRNHVVTSFDDHDLSSPAQPCSVMSGQTPVATSWSTKRISVTETPWLRMISAEMSTRPCVLETSGDRLRVQLTNTAARSEKSHRSCSQSCSCIAVSWVDMGADRSARPRRTRRGTQCGWTARTWI